MAEQVEAMVADEVHNLEIQHREFLHKKKVRWWGAAVAIVIIGWVGWPYYSAYALLAAVSNSDQVALESRVDWESVRQGLREDLKALFMQKMARDREEKSETPGGELGEGLAMLLAPTLIDRMVDSYVTPQGITVIVLNGGSKPEHRTPPSFDFNRLQYAFFSGGPFGFVVKIKPPQDQSNAGPLTAVFKWDGNWKLTRLFLPPGLTLQ